MDGVYVFLPVNKKSMASKKPALFVFILFISFPFTSFCQWQAKDINWTPDGTAYLKLKEGNIVRTDVKTNVESIVVKKEQLIPSGSDKPLLFNVYSFSSDNKTLLIFTNTAKVWRYNTRGDYWISELASNKLTQLGKGLPAQSLMFAKISPDGKKAAYVSGHDLYMEDLSSHEVTQLSEVG